jgi:hypothetical protein
LVGRLLTTDVEDFLLRKVEHGLEGEGRLADARLSTKQDDAAGNETATKDTVQFFVVHVDTGVIVIGDVTETEGFAGGGCRGLDGMARVQTPPDLS